MADFEPIKIPFEIPVAEIAKDTERVRESFADTDKSVARAEKKFNSWVKSQLQGVKATGVNVQVSKQYTSVLATLERRMKQAQDPKVVQAYANSIAKLKAEVKTLGQGATAMQPIKRQFDGLGNSINMITRDLPAFTFSAQTGFMAISNNIPMLADEIGRLTKRNKELLASGQKTKPVWKQVVGSLLSWQTALSAGIVLLTVYGKEIGEWVSSLFKGKKAVDVLEESQEELRKSVAKSSAEILTKYEKMRKEWEDLGNSLKTKEQYVRNNQDAFNKLGVAISDVNGADNLFIKKTEAFKSAILERAKATALAKVASKTYETYINKLQEADVREKQPNLYEEWTRSKDWYDRNGRRVLLNKGAVETADEMREEAENYRSEFEKIVNLQTEAEKKAREIMKTAGFEENDDAPTFRVIDTRKQLLDKIAALDTEYARKSFAKDQQELQALRDKFDKIREEVAKFNKNSKNKVKIDGSQLDAIQKNAENDLVYRQETKDLEKTLEVKKKLYFAYENYKTKVGKEAADKRYKSQLGDVEDYGAFLEKELAKLKSSELSGVQQERFSMITEQLQEYKENQNALYEEQLADLVSYEQKRKALVENFDKEYKRLLDDGQVEAAKVLKERHEQALGELDDAQIEKLNTYKALFDGIMRLSVKELKVVLANAKKMLQVENLSAELRAKIQRQIKEVEELLNTKQLDTISLIGKKVGELGRAFSELGKSIGNSGLAEVGSLLSGLGSSIDNVLVSFDKNASKADKISAGISGVITVIDTIASASAQRRKAEEEYYYSVLQLQSQYNLSLNEQIRLQSELKENVFLKDYIGRVKDGLKAFYDASEQYNKALQLLIDKGQAKTGLRKKVDWGNVGKATAGGAAAGAAIGAIVGSVVPVIGNTVVAAIGAVVGGVVGFVGGLFGGKKKVPKYQHILREYPELIQKSEDGQLRLNRSLAEQLKNNKLVSKETEKILGNLLAWDDAIKKAREQIKAVIKELTGSLSQNLKNNLVEAFKSGEDAAKAMGKTVDEVIENILSSLIFNKIFSKAFEDLEKEMVASQDIGGDGSWLDDLSRFFETSKGLTDDFNKAMAAAQAEAKRRGFDVFSKAKKSQSSANSLKGAVRGITEQQADLLAGQFGGLRLTQLDTNKILRSSHTAYMAKIGESIRVNKQIEINTRKTAENTNGMREGFKAVETAVKQRSNTMKANGI